MQRTFAAGEIGPALYGGSDQARYQAALAACRNFIVRRGGGVANRPGFEFISEVKDSTKATYLLKFIYSDDDTYIIEAGDGYFRFYRNGAQVVIPIPLAWSNLTAYVPGDLVSEGGTNYYCIAANLNHTPPNVTYWYPLTGLILEVPTPYAVADLPLLKADQSNDVVTLTHTGYPIYELRRILAVAGGAGWTMLPYSTAPWTTPPTSVAAAPGTAGSLNPVYVVTAAKADTYEETIGSTPATCSSSATPTAAAPNVITWDAVTGAAEYNVYVDVDSNGKYAFIGSTPNLTFNDIGFIGDSSVTPPVARTLFNATGDYPGTSTHHQQRQIFAGSLNEPEGVDASRTGAFKNFTISSPIQDDDAVSFGIAGSRINEVRHLKDIGSFIALTSTGEFSILGDDQGILRPTAINPRQQSYYGSAHIPPVIVGKALIYVQARGGMLRDFQFELVNNGSVYDGKDLTEFAQHLFTGRILNRMDYQQIPDSIVWCVRDDGTLLGMTYIKGDDRAVYGWHRHDTDGIFEDVCVVPESTSPPPGSSLRGFQEDVPYVIVRRSINGSYKRYVERMASRSFSDYRLDGLFLDSFLTYNGINASATTVTLSTSGGWTPADTITVTASSGVFTSGMVNDAITVWVFVEITQTTEVVRIEIDTFVSSTVMRGHVVKATDGVNVPVFLRTTPLTTWSRAVKTVGGLNHLAGKTVATLANGLPGTGLVVSDQLTIDDYADVIHVGLPITAEIETLDLDSDQQPVRDQQKLIKNVSVLVENSRTFQAGPDRDHLATYPGSPAIPLETDVFSASAGVLLTQMLEMNVNATWAKPGRIVIRQTDPLPLSILGLIPSGPIGG